jgi:23S rRNA pseudouridine1911/1915/1917 synthase
MAEETWRRHEWSGELSEARELFALVAEQVPGLSRSKAREAVAAGLVHLDGTVICEAKHTVPVGAHRLQIDLAQGIPNRFKRQAGPAPSSRGFTILHADAQCLVVDKDPGLLSAPGVDGEDDHLLTRLRSSDRALGWLGVVHRIDKETSGCLVIARTKAAQALLQAQFSAHAAGRRYRALTYGGPRRDQDLLDGAIGRGPDGRRCVVPEGQGKSAKTHFKVVRRRTLGTEFDLQLETGRTHQIRIHLAAIGCHLIGDPVYGLRRLPDGAPRSPRMMLHATEIAFDHPMSGERMKIAAPLPPVFDQIATRLGPITD